MGTTGRCILERRESELELKNAKPAAEFAIGSFAGGRRPG